MTDITLVEAVRMKKIILYTHFTITLLMCTMLCSANELFTTGFDDITNPGGSIVIEDPVPVSPKNPDGGLPPEEPFKLLTINVPYLVYENTQFRI